MRTYWLSLIYLLFRQCRCKILEYWPPVFKTFWLGNELGNKLVNLRNYVMNQLICILTIFRKLYWIESFTVVSLAWHYYNIYYVNSLHLHKPLFHFWYKFKPNKIKARGLRSEYYSSYFYASKYIILQFFVQCMYVLNLTQYDTY